MKYLHSWLQEHIDGTLPPKEEVARVLSMKSLEVEEIHEEGDNVVYDVKTLPHRAHDVMSHRGLARELATLFDLKRKTISFPEVRTESDMSVRVSVGDTTKCPRYSAVYVEGVTVSQSPEWLVQKLVAIGQRSISNIVDITNFVMNDMGQPMHAFDAHKVVGGITVRFAVEGETMTTLDGKAVTLTGTETVIADDEGVLALAGVKGGTKAIVDEKTTAIIFESANFNATLTRQTSDKHGIRTDSSKRYEQGMTSDFAGEAMKEALALIKECCPHACVGPVVDVYSKPEKEYIVGVSLEEVNAVLGTAYEKKDVEQIFKRLNVSCKAVVPREVISTSIDEVLGKPYNHGASVRHDAPRVFDCSSLTAWIYATAGIALPRVSVDQYVYSEKVAAPNYGDLVFSNTQEGNIHTKTVNYMPGTEVKEGVDHVGIYMGDGEVLHATRSKDMVVVEPIANSSSFKHVIGYGRVTPYLTQERYVVTIPNERLDLRIKEDLIEEIGRIMGYDSIAGTQPKVTKKGLPHKRLYYETKIKNILLQNGFSEIYTYTFGSVGDVRIVKGLASDKEKLRTNLGQGVLQALQMNLHNAPLLGIDTVKVFEFGNVFTEDTERRNFALAIDDGKKKTSFTEEVDLILSHIKRELKIDYLEYNTLTAKPYVIELDFDALIESLPEPKSYEPLSQTTSLSFYQSVSPYPFIVRDIAVWTPKGTTWEEIEELAKTINDPRIIRIDCFDTFTKTIEGKGEMTSYAFRFVIQSHEKTLTDEEANAIADKMYSLLKEKGYEIR